MFQIDSFILRMFPYTDIVAKRQLWMLMAGFTKQLIVVPMSFARASTLTGASFIHLLFNALSTTLFDLEAARRTCEFEQRRLSCGHLVMLWLPLNETAVSSEHLIAVQGL